MSSHTHNNSFHLAIIGGGASGITCAIACVQAARAAGIAQPRIVLLEAGKRIGASIMRSGNGRCNFSHAHLDIERYHNASFVKQAFAALDRNPAIPSVIAWFEDLGLVWSEMPGSGGLLYPFSRKANSVLDVLRCALDEFHIEVRTYTRVKRVDSAFRSDCAREGNRGNGLDRAAELDRSDGFERADGRVQIETGRAQIADGRASRFTLFCEEKLPDQDDCRSYSIQAEYVVVASGGATPKELFGGVGLDEKACAYLDPNSVLGPLKAVAAQGISLKALDGIRMQAGVTLPERNFSEAGEVLFRKYGVSGIVIFNASRYAQLGDELLLDFVPETSEKDLHTFLSARAKQLARRDSDRFLTGFLETPLAEALLKAVGVKNHRSLTEKQISQLAHLLKAFPLKVQGIADERSCQVHRGGVSPDCIDASTMQFVTNSGLYVVGEALDVDGPCGGYNLHWAWTTGLLSGYAVVSEIQKAARGDAK